MLNADLYMLQQVITCVDGFGLYLLRDNSPYPEITQAFREFKRTVNSVFSREMHSDWLLDALMNAHDVSVNVPFDYAVFPQVPGLSVCVRDADGRVWDETSNSLLLFRAYYSDFLKLHDGEVDAERV